MIQSWGLRIIFLLHYVCIQYAFEVKVLLQKMNLRSDDMHIIELQSHHGFMIADNPDWIGSKIYPEKNLRISTLSGSWFLNNVPIKEHIVYVQPVLSQVQQSKILKTIETWFENHMQSLSFDSINQIHHLFDLLVTQNMVDDSLYAGLSESVFFVVQSFFDDVINKIQEREPAIIPLKSLIKLSHQLFDDRIKNAFLQEIACAQLTKKDRKELIKNKEYRYEFFESMIYAIAQNMVEHMVSKVSNRFVCQMIQEPCVMIQADGNSYVGTFILFKQNDFLFVINSLDIDDYLFSVIKYEGWPGWPLEMNKVLAIICRTYLVWQILQAQKIDRPYHIQNGINHQTYKGHHVNAKLKHAIEQTKDLFVAFNNKPALTMYDACCGGIIPGHIDDVEYKKISYLARNYPCTFCKNFKIFNWHVHVNQEKLLEQLQKEYGSKINKIVSVQVGKKDKAGLVKTIIINVGTRKITIHDKKFKKFFPEIKSSCFDFNMSSHKKLDIEGKGYGHHRGLCQWGACKLVKDDGWNVEEVLQFYYPGTNLMKLTY